MGVEDVAMGFIRVANEAMCRPIRALTQVNDNSFSLIAILLLPNRVQLSVFTGVLGPFHLKIYAVLREYFLIISFSCSKRF